MPDREKQEGENQLERELKTKIFYPLGPPGTHRDEATAWYLEIVRACNGITAEFYSDDSSGTKVGSKDWFLDNKPYFR